MKYIKKYETLTQKEKESFNIRSEDQISNEFERNIYNKSLFKFNEYVKSKMNNRWGKIIRIGYYKGQIMYLVKDRFDNMTWFNEDQLLNKTMIDVNKYNLL